MFATVRSGDGDMVEEGWAGLADPETTVALYMGRDSARAAAARLMAEGRSSQTPALAVENAGRPDARLLRTRLGELGAVVEAAQLDGPVLLLVGQVAAQARRRTAPDQAGAAFMENARRAAI